MKPYYEHNGITIYHGDCTVLLRELETVPVHLVLTDPPYGIENAVFWRENGDTLAEWGEAGHNK